MGELQRFTAFTDTPSGGNPAGVWVGERFPSDPEMLSIASEVGFSETVFAVRSDGNRFTVRYFSPKVEVPFCGHATIALGGRLADDIGPGRYILDTAAGQVPVEADSNGGVATATLTSVEPESRVAPDDLADRALELLGWSRNDLSPSLEPAVIFAGAHHLLLAVLTRERLADVGFDFDDMAALMLAHNLTTVDLIWRESPQVFHSRNLFPVGGVMEDPATGAAAAALGGHLRQVGAIGVPGSLEIHQGVDMGRPSLIHVTIPTAGGIGVTGTTVRL